jgi:hypothetical protein
VTAKFLTAAERQIRPQVQVVEYRHFVCLDWKGNTLTRWFTNASDRDRYAQEMIHVYSATILETGEQP